MNRIKELTQQEKYNTMLKRKNREIEKLRQENAQIGMLNADLSIYLKEHKARIDKAIEFIEDGDLLYLASKCSVIYRDNIEVVAIRDRLIELLDILKGSGKNGN